VTWLAGPRADWVRLANAGGVPPLSRVAAQPFEPAGLLAEAAALHGIEPGPATFGTGDFHEPLGVLCRAFEEEAALTTVGRWMTRRFVVRLLGVRLQLAAYRRADPGVTDEVIDRPLVVTGAPRTGTTILYALLAEDPALRVPRGWELLRPVPPPDPGRVGADPRVALCELELTLPTLVAPELGAIHAYGPTMPKECLSALSLAFRSEEFISRYHVPSYVRWLAGADPRPAYDMHRLVLQVLQRRSGPVRWVLKSPVHLQALPTLLAVYPDAELAITHRDPLAVLGSVTSLIATLRSVHSDTVEFAAIGRYHAELYGTSLDRLVDHRDAGLLDPSRVYHGRYAEFVADPLGAVGALYTHLGRPWPAETAARQRAVLEGPAAHAGGHRYAFADLGLDPAAERRRFARYQRAFAVPDEQ